MNETNAYSLISPEKTILSIPGLSQPVRLLQITDSHLCHTDERESPYTCDIAKDRIQCFARYPNVGTEDIFENHLCFGEDIKPDLLVFTGDILDFPSQMNLDELDRLLNRDNRLPYLFVTGNHDRSRYYITGNNARFSGDRHILSSFMDADGFERRNLTGVTLLGVDNTDYQVTQAQLDALRATLSEGKSCILFLHIPLYEPTLEQPVMDIWHSPIVMGIPEHLYADRPGVIPAPLPTEVTQEFCHLCGEAENLLAVFSGHLHFSHAGPLASGNPQYVTAPGFEGGCRVISLVP